MVSAAAATSILLLVDMDGFLLGVGCRLTIQQQVAALALAGVVFNALGRQLRQGDEVILDGTRLLVRLQAAG